MGVFYHCPTNSTTMGSKKHADHSENFSFFFSIPTATVQPHLMAPTVIYCYNPGLPCVYPQPPSHLVLVSCDYVYAFVSCIAAEVMIGKGLTG